MKQLTPKGAAIITGLAALIFSATMLQAYSVSHSVIVLALIVFYFGGATWTLVLQRRNPAAALLMMRSFVLPSAVMSLLAVVLTFAVQGRLQELSLLR